MLTALLKRSFTLSASARVSTLALVLGIGLAVVPGPFNQMSPAVGATHRASNGANAQYYAIGLWWRDKKIWVRESETICTGTVSNPRYTFETRTRKRIILPSVLVPRTLMVVDL
jgi:hypothetical protein